MNKKLIVILSIILVCLLIVFGFYKANGNSTEGAIVSENYEGTVCINENCFDVEIADTAEERQKGLMNRDQLPMDKGMLFIFEESGKHSFWMKNTYISLDLIWIDEANEISSIKQNAQPCKTENCERFIPNSDSKYVLEIYGGLVSQLGIKEGDKVTFIFN